jgi:hypothetical protein
VSRSALRTRTPRSWAAAGRTTARAAAAGPRSSGCGGGEAQGPPARRPGQDRRRGRLRGLLLDVRGRIDSIDVGLKSNRQDRQPIGTLPDGTIGNTDLIPETRKHRTNWGRGRRRHHLAGWWRRRRIEGIGPDATTRKPLSPPQMDRRLVIK